MVHQQICDGTEESSPVGAYLEHRRAMQQTEDKKLRHLATMKLAQQVRAKFLRMSLEERKVFIDVLTADADGSFTTLFALQTDLVERGVDDEDLALVEDTSRGLKRLERGKTDHRTWAHAVGVVNDSIIRREIKKGKLAKPRKGKMPLALPEGSNE